MRLLTESEIRAAVTPAEALAAVREAFAQLARGHATLPDVLFLDLPEQRGEVHVKGAYLHGSPYFSVKAASGFYGNPERGLPVGSGAVWVFSSTTGFLEGILFDNGYLTDLRTGAAGALAADLLANRRIRRVGVLGCGSQARYQLRALLDVRQPESVVVFGRNAENARRYASEMTQETNLPVVAVGSAREAVEGSDLIITTTPARSPVVESAWVRPGTHITAVGADLPEKRELDPDVIARADKIVCDSRAQCLTQGELHHAVTSGGFSAERVYAELGELAAGQKAGRTNENEITVADLTGLGIQDAALANLVAGHALRQDLGRMVEV